MDPTLKTQLKSFSKTFEGEFYFDNLHRHIYATDASVYRILPLAVAYPKHKDDIKKLVRFAQQVNSSIIPRAAGTSLAGQCVGSGIVMDVSKYLNAIIALNPAAKTVTVQPGVVRDTLNAYLKPYGLFFGPNTSTSNRCMIGGMVGNNSSGTTSIQYGVTRDKVLQLKTILSDGSDVEFSELSPSEFIKKTRLPTTEGAIYKEIYALLSPKPIQKQIHSNYPKPIIHRRNTGYAIDDLIRNTVFNSEENTPTFNMCKLLTGSEGTLALTTEITLQLDDLPPKHNAMVVLHFKSITSCLQAVKTAMQFNLYTCEMLDDTILNLTKHNKNQQENRQFIQGNPKAILLCELKATCESTLKAQTELFTTHVLKHTDTYAAPVLLNKAITRANTLRKAGLGLLGNIIGDKKAVACIEDTAVALEDLEAFIAGVTTIMNRYNQSAVYYAHAGAGELHLRPILNLKKQTDVALFKAITTDVATLVKSYNGSFSGEHGDGIVRAQFIPIIIGAENYQLLQQVKHCFDPENIFNPGKIVAPLAMDDNLRYTPNRTEPELKTLLNFSTSKGILREAEKCNGSGDCRKSVSFGGTMCPSFRATNNEKDTTRARANALREFLTHPKATNAFNHSELKSVFDLCLSCKACKTECPSSVDVAALKAEFLYQYQSVNGFTLRDTLFANANSINKIAAKVPWLCNALYRFKPSAFLIKKTLGIHKHRSLPLVTPAFTNKIKAQRNPIVLTQVKHPIKTVYLFVDAFTNYLESDIAADAVSLLGGLNYKVVYLPHAESGRAQISKGFLQKAKQLANANITTFKSVITANTPLLGIEPSAILSFKDDYLRLADNISAAKTLAEHCMLIETFIQQEIQQGNIKPSQFTKAKKTIKFHGHCHQKALTNQRASFDALNLPENYKVTIIPSGCCGMAGSFGYEKDKFNISQTIANQTLFPAIQKADKHTIIAANGTSCRHQIKDGTSRKALHPIRILKQALIN